jgi:hypothetical protein
MSNVNVIDIGFIDWLTRCNLGRNEELRSIYSMDRQSELIMSQVFWHSADHAPIAEVQHEVLGVRHLLHVASVNLGRERRNVNKSSLM